MAARIAYDYDTTTALAPEASRTAGRGAVFALTRCVATPIAALAALRARGAPRAVLMTAATNAPAQHLFERAGFRPTMIEMTREPGRAHEPM